MKGPDMQGAAGVGGRGVELGEKEVLEGGGQRACGARRKSSRGRVSEEFDPDDPFIIPTDISLRQNPFPELEYRPSIPCCPLREKHDRPLFLSPSFSEGLIHSVGRYVILCRREASTGEKRSKSVREVAEEWRLNNGRRSVNSG